MLVSEGQELAMGKQSDPAIIAQFGLYQDEKLQQYINTMGDRMGAISHRPELNYQFRIVDSPVINAFAVPGGYVYFTRGIMAHFNNEAQFAGVLGHEIGHVTARHSAKQQTTAILSQVGLIGAMIASAPAGPLWRAGHAGPAAAHAQIQPRRRKSGRRAGRGVLDQNRVQRRRNGGFL